MPEIHLPQKPADLQNRWVPTHPMFQYQVPPVEAGTKTLFKKYQRFVVVGMGGSVLPLKAFVDYFCLSDRILFLDSLDSGHVDRCLKMKQTLFCIASKSGETLEIKTLLSEIYSRKLNKNLFFVTDPARGLLRTLAQTQKIPSLEIPSNLGGRFTNFSVFHRALLERFGVSFDRMLGVAQKKRDELQRNPSLLCDLFSGLFNEKTRSLILWSYDSRLRGLCEWAQQALAESLGKKTSEGKRFGVLPTILNGPQDQHSVLQLLTDGPQDKTLWFFVSSISPKSVRRTNLPEALKDFKNKSLGQIQKILADSTFETFCERLSQGPTAQPLVRWSFSKGPEELVEFIVCVQALVEFAALRLGVNAFDQPGVERGKEIARELLKVSA